ncbi:MAG: DNA adenine methylase [Chloroflexi bacterium]|nr:DNA adenine methylase [Chloroflexota bacterium]
MSPETIINVASVKHRSPFRYPGGKTWLVPRIYTWLTEKHQPSIHFIEPFAGGAIVGLSVAFEELARYVTLVELDEQVAAVWQTVIETDDGLWLADQIREFEMTPENVDELFSKPEVSLRERAFQTIVKNRVNRGGILASGAGRLKHGENGRGILSRWYPDTLAKRIRDIVNIKARLTFVYGDGLQVIEDHIDNPDVAFFIDPPYTASSKKPGRRLYDHSEIDHHRLFSLLAQASGDFLMTYDNAEEVDELAASFGFDTLAIPMKNTHHAKLTELLIGRDLEWARE